MIKRVKVNGLYYIFIKKCKGAYYPLMYNFHSFIFGVVSPSLVGLYTQDELKEGYETGYIIWMR